MPEKNKICMGKFNFAQDVAGKMLFRHYFSVEADNEKEALQKVEKYKTCELMKDGVDRGVRVELSEWLYDDWNGASAPVEGFPSIELMDKDMNILGTNEPLCVLQQHERVFLCSLYKERHGCTAMIRW